MDQSETSFAPLLSAVALPSHRRVAARRAMPYSQRLLVEDDETRLRKVLAAEAKKGDPAGKVARGLARLQVHASVADPGLLAAAKKCATAAARREGLAAEATRLEKKGELREALQQCVADSCLPSCAVLCSPPPPPPLPPLTPSHIPPHMCPLSSLALSSCHP